MKKSKAIVLSISAILFLSLSSCTTIKGEKGEQGEQGIKGETGPKGDKGDPGKDGNDGIDGASWLTGISKPADSLGKLGDMYLNTTNGDVYQKEESGWKLKMNIQGEDGEDGKDGLNGSSGSQGRPGETAYSNTILPSSDGKIIPSLGSQLVDEEISFTFEPNNSLSTNDDIIWTLYKADGDTINLSGEKITLPMEEGGFVVSASIKQNTSIINTKEEFKDKLSNLESGLNTIILNDEISLDAEDFNTEVSTLNTNSLIKTRSNTKNKDFFKTGKIEITTNNKENVEVEILSNGKHKELRFPMLNIVADNLPKFRFNNISLVCDYDMDVLGTPVGIFNNFINCRGVDELSFNNCEFTLDIKEGYSNQDLMNNGIPNFINFDGTTLSFNNFKQNPQHGNYSCGFISVDANLNKNLISVKMNNSTVYTSVPFNIDFDFTSDTSKKELEIYVNNCEFYNYRPANHLGLMSFFSLYNTFYEKEDVNEEINIDINNVSYNKFWDEEYIYGDLLLNGTAATMFNFCDWDLDREGETKDPHDSEYYLNYDINNSAIDLSDKVTINVNNYKEYNQRVTPTSATKELPFIERKNDESFCEIHQEYESLVSFDLDKYNELFFANNKRFYMEKLYKILTECYFDHTYIDYDYSKYPTLYVDGEEMIYNN